MAAPIVKRLKFDQHKLDDVTAGIYDPETKKYACTCAYPAEKLSGDYAWYTVGTFDPATLSAGAYLYVGDGYLDKQGKRFVPALYIDKIRFQACNNKTCEEESK